MTQTKYYFTHGTYESKVRPAIIRLGGERLTNPDSRADCHDEFYFMGKFRAGILCPGKNSLTICGLTEVVVKRAASKLESLAGVKLTKLPNQ